MSHNFSQLTVKKVVMAALLGVFFLACVEKDKPEPEPIPEPEPVPQILTAMFDKTEYFPFDAIAITLSEKATGQEYNGTLGDTPVTAVRMDDSTLVMLTPDLPAGDYTLTIPFSDKPNEKKVEGRLRIKPLPTVENPDAVIEEITATIAQNVSQAKQDDAPNADLQEGLLTILKDELAKMTDAERQQLAAFWVSHPELNITPEIELRNDYIEKVDKLKSLTRQYVFTQITMAGFLGISGVSGIVTLVLYYSGAPQTEVVGAITVAAFLIFLNYADYADLLRTEIVQFAYIYRKDILKGLNFTPFPSVRNGEIEERSESSYDYTFINGESFTCDYQIALRSIAREDDQPGAVVSAETAEIISTNKQHITNWEKLFLLIEDLRNLLFDSVLPELGGRPPSISQIFSPVTEEMVTIEDFTIEIVSGEVRLQTTGADTYSFTTEATEPVEFQFKMIADGLESPIYTALLEIEAAPEITTTTLPEGKVGEPYNFTLAATGAQPISWVTIDGITPVGITFYTETGEISGIPEESGTFKFFMRAKNDFGEDVKELTMIINEKDEEDEDTEGDGANLFVGTWWSEGLDATLSSAFTIQDDCRNEWNINSTAQLQAFYANNYGVVTFTSDGKFLYNACGEPQEGTWLWDRDRNEIQVSTPRTSSPSTTFRLDFQRSYSSSYPLGGWGGHYRKVSGDMTTPFITVSPSTYQFAATGEQKSFTVTSNTYWRVSPYYNNNSWFTVSTDAGSNNGDVTFTAKANTSDENWGGFIVYYYTGGGFTGGGNSHTQSLYFNIGQDAAPFPIVSPETLHFAATGEQKEFTVTSTTNWTVSSDVSWATVSPVSGSLDGTAYVTTPIAVTVEENKYTNQRTGTIYANNSRGGWIPVSITQDGALPPGVVPVLTVEPSSLNFTSSGEQKSFTVTSNISWTVISDAAWATVSTASGSNNGMATVTVTSNTDTSQRTAVITVSGSGITRTISLTQEGATPTPTLTVEPAVLSFTSSGGQQSFNITANTDWTVSSNDSWATVSPASGSNNGTVNVTVAANTGTGQRTATVTVSGSGNTQTVNITQAGITPELTVEPSELVFSASSEQLSFTVSSNTDWTVSSGASWATVSPASGSSNGTVTVTTTANTGTSARTTTVTVSGTGVQSQTISIEQIAEQGGTINIVGTWERNYKGNYFATYKQRMIISPNGTAIRESNIGRIIATAPNGWQCIEQERHIVNIVNNRVEFLAGESIMVNVQSWSYSLTYIEADYQEFNYYNSGGGGGQNWGVVLSDTQIRSNNVTWTKMSSNY